MSVRTKDEEPPWWFVETFFGSLHGFGKELGSEGGYAVNTLSIDEKNEKKSS